MIDEKTIKGKSNSTFAENRNSCASSENESEISEKFSEALGSLLSNQVNSPLQELSTSDLEFSLKIRQKYGLSEEDNSFKERRMVEEEDEAGIILDTLERICKKLIDDLINGKGGNVEEGHKSLDPLLVLIELCLIYKIKSLNDIWGFIQKFVQSPEIECSVEQLANAKMAMENVKAFSLLRTGLSKLKAWIRMALMNKSLSIILASFTPASIR